MMKHQTKRQVVNKHFQMTYPRNTLIWMCLFTLSMVIAGFFLVGELQKIFNANPGYNAFIAGVWLIGVFINFRQIIQLYPEINWIQHYQHNMLMSASITEPKMLASVARMLEDKQQLTLSASSMQTILDSIRTRVEESRDLSRYLIGSLIFLGLLGTFWGLMATVASIGELVGNMSVESGTGAAIFENFKNSLAEPLSGMGIAFSSSLVGLSGSLFVGLLDLQISHAQNRFVNELEEWLSSSTRLSSGIIADESEGIGAPAYVQALLEKTADALEKMQRNTVSEDQQQEKLAKQLTDMRAGFERFNDLLDKQNKQFDRSNSNQIEIINLLKDSTAAQNDATINEELRSELRLLTKTIANALSSRGG